MAKFHSLIVTDVKNTIRDAIVVSLKSEDTVADFDFTQGQYLTFRQMIEGTEIRRSYSICAGKGEELKIGIKRVEGGAFSNWANDTLAPGMRVEAMPPMGSFTPQSNQSVKKTISGLQVDLALPPTIHSENHINERTIFELYACLCKPRCEHYYVQRGS